MTLVFKEYGIPLKIFTDKGTEFLNKDVEAFLKELNIRQWYSNYPGKAVMAERFNRTLKDGFWVHMTDQNNYRYIDVLDDVVKRYNASEHSSTGYAPKDVTHGHVHLILGRSSGAPIGKSPQFKVGDTVRVSTSQLTFEKGYETNYSEMVFRITEVRESDGHVLYRIADLANKGQPGWFYEQELSKVILDERENCKGY